MNKERRPVIVQSVRRIGLGEGVGSVVWHLEEKFQQLGYSSLPFTLASLKYPFTSNNRDIYFKKLKLFFEVLFYSIIGTWVLRRRYKKRKDCVVICHNDALFGDIYVNHGLHKAWLMHSKKRLQILLRNPLHLFLLCREWLRYKLNVHSVVVSFSPSDREDLMKFHGVPFDKIRLIPLGIDADRFYPSNEIRRQKREELDLSNEQFVLLFIGHEFDRKGLEYVISSLTHLPENVCLEVVGGNDYLIQKYTAIAKQNNVSDRVRFHGVSRDTPAFYNAADLFVLPTAYETWALVGIEAIASGTPILMTKVGGIPQYLREREDGFFITEDPTDIADKVEQILRDHDLRLQFSRRAREIALEYTWENIAKQYLALIQNIWEKKQVG